MKIKTNEELILEYKMLRAKYFNVYGEDITKFEKYQSHHMMYEIVVKHLDKSFREINQIAQEEIELFISK